MSEPFDKAQDKIIPAILARSVSELESKLSEIPEEVKLVHIDVLEEDIWTQCDRDFEVHLMVQEPEKIMSKWVERGAKSLILHTLGSEASKWRESVEIGLAVEIDVALEEVFLLIPQVDFVQLMSIAQIGAQGYPFDERIFDRIKEVKNKFPDMPLSVDGGINTTNYKALEDLGIEKLIVGSGFKDLWSRTKHL